MSREGLVVLESRRFPWIETASILHSLWREGGRFDEGLGAFTSAPRDGVATVVRPPRILPVDAASASVDLASPGLCALALVRAGASALGVWRDDVLLAHKVIRKYVVRGSGKAQPLHRKTKGKSRYGSRLRLQNYAAQLAETNERLASWSAEFGRFDRLDLACPQRLRADLEAAPPGLPRDVAATHVPLTVRAPDFAELKRIRFELAHGEWSRVAIG